jgi:hypothetical protein
MTSPVEEPQQQAQPLQRPSWVQDLIDKRSSSDPRLKRTPVGFNFSRDPFDPSSYYRQQGTFRSISQAATNVTRQEVENRQQREMQAAYEKSQAQMQNSLGNVNPNFTYNGPSFNGQNHQYHLKGVSNNTSNAADYWGGKYGIKNIGGLGPGSVPGSDHPKGRALDFMTYSNKKKGDALANDIIKNYKAWNVKYVIWYRYIWQPGRGWHRYSGPSPHTDHVHVSFNK